MAEYDLIPDFQVGRMSIKNFAQLKEDLGNELEQYRRMEVTEDNILQAKATRAKLNNASKTFNSARIRYEKDYMEPFNFGKNQINELISMISDVSSTIDSGIKSLEEKEEQKKRADIVACWEQLCPSKRFNVERIWNPKWLNKSVTMDSVMSDLQSKAKEINGCLEAIKSLSGTPDFIRAVTINYENTMDLTASIEAEKRREELIKSREAEEDRLVNESIRPSPEVPKEEPKPVGKANELPFYRFGFVISGSEEDVKSFLQMADSFKKQHEGVILKSIPNKAIEELKL